MLTDRQKKLTPVQERALAYLEKCGTLVFWEDGRDVHSTCSACTYRITIYISLVWKGRVTKEVGQVICRKKTWQGNRTATLSYDKPVTFRVSTND